MRGVNVLRNIKNLSVLMIIFAGICLFQTTVFANLVVLQSPSGSEGKWVNWDVSVKPQCYDGDHSVNSVSKQEYSTWKAISNEGITSIHYSISMDEEYQERYKIGGLIPTWKYRTKHRDITESASTTIYIDKTSPVMENILVDGTDATGLVKNFTEGVKLTPHAEDVYPVGVKDISGVKGFQYSINSGTWTNGNELKLSTEGVYEVAFRAYDNAGNYSKPIKTTVIIDRTLQDVTQIADDKGKTFNSQNTSDITWKYTEPVRITASGNSAEGSKGFEYRINDGDWTTGSTLDVTEDGLYNILFRGVGKYDNYSDEKGVTVIIDREGPRMAEDMNENWQSVETCEVNLRAVDELTYVKRVQYSVNNSSIEEAPEGSIVFTVSDEGETPFFIKATDELGNESEINYTVRIDRTKPVISLRDISGKTLETNNLVPIKTNKSYTVNASAFDELSGIESIKYRLNNGDWILGKSVQINESGKWNIEFEAFDKADNCINSGILSVVVDVDPPEVTFIGTDGNWTNEKTVAVSVYAVDTLSEVGRIEISTDGITWEEGDEITVSREGESTFYVRVSDIWGNVARKTITIKIDRTFPQITIKDHNDLEIKSTVNPYKYNKKPTTFTLISEDTISGIEILRYRVNNGEWINEDRIELDKSGSWMLEVEAIDRATNKTTSGIISVMLDVDAPEVFIKGTDEAWKNRESISVSADVYDSFSGIESLEYSIDGLNWQMGNELVITDEKETVVKFKATDSFGNVTIKEGPVRIDRSIPVLELNNPSSPVPYEKVEVSCNARDKLSGINESTMRYSLDGGEWVSGKTAVVVKEGITDIKFEVGDNAGNIATVSEAVYIDRKAPEITEAYLKESLGIEFLKLEDGGYTELDKLLLFVSAKDYFVDQLAEVSHYLYSISFSPTREGVSETKVAAEGGSFKVIPLEALKKGINYIYIYAVDMAGNRSPVKSLCIKVDGDYPQKPEIRSSTHPFASTAYDAVNNRKAVFNIGVGTSGVLEVKEYRYSLYKGEQVLVKDATTTGSIIEFGELEDNAVEEYYKLYVDLVSGNGRKTREPAEYNFRIDSKPPEFLKINSATHPVENNWYNNGQVSFEWNMPADFTGVKAFYYQLEDIEEGEPYTVAEAVYEYRKSFLTTENLKVDFDLSEDGDKKHGKVRLIVFAEDFSGNVQWDEMTAAYDIEKPWLEDLGNTKEKLKVFASGSNGITMEWGEPKDNTGVFNISAGIMEYGVDDNWSYFIKGQSTSHTYKDLKPDSTYLLVVRLNDMAGNIRTYQKAFRIDGKEMPVINTFIEEIVCGYKVEIMNSPEEESRAWLVLPESLDFKATSSEDGKIKLDKDLKLEDGQFVSGGSDMRFEVNADGMKLRCEGLYISHNGLVIKKAYYKPFGYDREIAYFDVKLSSPPQGGIIKSSISEEKIEEYSVGGFLLKDITGTYLQSGSFVINAGMLDAGNINCFREEGDISSSSLLVKNLVVSKDGIIKGGRIAGNYKLKIFGNTYLIKDGLSIIKEGIIVVDEAELEVAGKFGTFKICNFSISDKGVVNELEKFSWLECENSGLKIDSLTFKDGEMLVKKGSIEAKDTIKVELSEVPVKGGMLECNEGNMPKAFVKPGYGSFFVSSNTLEVSSMKISIDGLMVDVDISTGNVKGLINGTYDLENSKLNIYRNIEGTLELSLKGEILLKGDAVSNFGISSLSVIESSLDPDGNIISVRARNEDEINTLIAGNAVLSKGYLNFTYDSGEKTTHLKLDGFLNSEGLVSLLTLGQGVKIDKLKLKEDGNFEAFEVISACGLYDEDTNFDFETIGIPEQEIDTKAVEGQLLEIDDGYGNKFTNSFVKSVFDEKSQSIRFEVNGEYVLSSGMIKGLKSEKVLIEKIIIDNRGKISSIASKGLLKDKISFCSAVEMSDPFLRLLPDETGLNFNLLVGGRFKVSDKYKKLKEFYVDTESVIIRRDGGFKEIKAGRNISGKVPFIGNTSLRDAYAGIYASDEKELKLEVKGTVLLPIDAGEVYAKTLELEIRSFVMNSEGEIEELDIGTELPGQTPFIGMSQLKDAAVSMYKDDEKGIWAEISGSVIIPDMIEGEKDAELNINKLAVDADARLIEMDINGILPNKFSFLGGTVLEDSAVGLVKEENTSVELDFSGNIVLPQMEIEALSGLKLGINSLRIGLDGDISVVDANLKLAKDIEFAEGMVLRNGTVGVAANDDDLRIGLGGVLVLPDNLPGDLSGAEIKINTCEFDKGGKIVNLDSSLSFESADFMGVTKLKDTTVKVLKDSVSGIRIEVDGKILLPENVPGALKSMELAIESFKMDLKGEILEFKASTSKKEKAELFGEYIITENLKVSAYHNDNKDMEFSVGGQFYFKGLSDSTEQCPLVVNSFIISEDGTIKALDMKTEGINTGLFGFFELTDGVLAVKKGDSEESTIDIKGSIRTSDNFPSGIKGKTLTINSCIISLDGDIRSFEAALGDAKVFGGFGISNGKIYIREYEGEKCAGIGGQLALDQNYPEGIKGKVLDIKSFIIGRDGQIKDLDIGMEGINTVLFDSLVLTEGAIKAISDNGKNLMFSVTGNLALGDVFPESVRSKSITLNKLTLSSGGIKDFDAVVEDEVSFELPGGIEVKATSVGLSREGLSLSGSLTLPQNYPEGFKGLKIDVRKLEMGWNGKVKAIYTTTSQFQTTLAGFKVEVKDLGFEKDMVKIGSLMLVLPDNMDNMRLGIKNAYITSDGKFHGEFAASDIKKDIGGCNLKLTGLSLDIFDKRINFEKAMLSLPDELGGASVGLNGVELDCDGIKFKGGAFRLPSFKISNAVTISNSYVDFKIEGKDDFYIEGGASISIAEIGSFEGIISFGNRSDEYPIGLRRAEFTCSIPGTGIPIANSGLYIKTITGGIAFGPPYELPSKVRNMFDSGMRIKVGVGFKDASGGNIVSGNGLMWIDLTNCGIALKGDVTVVSGCARGEIVAAITRQGFYGDVGIEMNFVRGRVTIYVYKYNGSTSVSGKSKLEIGVEKGAVLDKKIGWGKFSFRLRIPPSDFWLGSVNADFGRFTNGSNGVKAYVSLPWGIGEIGVFASKHSMKVGKVSSYDIYLPPWAQYGSTRIYASAEVNEGFSIPDQNKVVYNFDVGGLNSAEDLGRVLLTVAYPEEEPEILLRSPSGKSYGVDSPNVFVSYHDWGMLIALLEPEEGTWSFEASKVANKNEFDVGIYGLGKVPKISIESVDIKDSKALVKGFAINPGNNSKVDVYLSDSMDSHMGIPAGTCQIDKKGAFSAQIDLMAFPNGEYYAWAVLTDDEDNPDVSDVYENTVKVELQRLSLKAVTGFVATDDGKGGISYMFEDTNGKNTKGFKLYIDNITKKEHIEINLGYITQNTLPGFDKGDIVKLEAAAYDYNGNEGERSSPIVIEIGAQKDNINTFIVEKIEDISICAGKSAVVKIDILNQNPVVTGGAYDYAAFKVLEIPDGLDINAGNYIKICSGTTATAFEIFASNDLEPGKYVINGILENMGNSSIVEEILINVKVSYDNISVKDTGTVFIIPSEGYEVEIHGENFNKHTKVFMGEREIEAEILDQNFMVVKVPEDASFGETELVVVGANKDSHKIKVEVIEPSYRLMLSKNETFINKGESDTVHVFAKSLNGYANDIQLSANDIPEGWKVYFETEAIKPDETGIMHIEVSQKAMGVYYLSVVSGTGEMAVLKVTVTEEEHNPYISKLSINRGVAGDKVKIYGGCFKPDGRVYLGDSVLILASIEDNVIEVVLPEGVHTGNISYRLNGEEYPGPKVNILTDIKLVVASGEPDSKGFYNTKPQVELYSMLQDNNGLNYSINGGEYKPYAGAFVVGQGINTVEAFINDENGKTISKGSWTIKYKEKEIDSLKESTTNTNKDTNTKINTNTIPKETTVEVSTQEIPAFVPSDIAVSISTGKNIYLKGQTIEYRIKFKNAANTASDEFRMVAGIPENTKVVDADGGEVKENIVVWTIPGLDGNLESEKILKVSVSDFSEQEILVSNYAVIESDKELLNKDKSTIPVMLRSFASGNVIHKAYIKGYSDGTIRPDNEITRAEVAAIFKDILGLDESEEGGIGYSDLKDGHWASGVIGAVTKAGIFKGFKDGTFRPDEMISRAELSTVISNYLKMDIAKPYKIDYPDIDGHWALNCIEEISRYNIVNGYEDGTFRPDVGVKRCEAVTMINRMLYRGPLKSVESTFADLEVSHWAYEDILEAAIDHNLTLDTEGNEIMNAEGHR